MAGYLIKDTTREERERIVEESLGNIEGGCDGCAPGLAEMYQAYIDGKKELREINMELMPDMCPAWICQSETAAAWAECKKQER